MSVDGYGVSGVFEAPFFGRVEWQWRQAGSDAWWMVLASHLSSGRVVSGASEIERLVKWAVGCAESKKAEAAGHRLQGRSALRAKEQIVDVPVIEEMKLDPPSARADRRTCTSVSFPRRDWGGGEVDPTGMHQRTYR